MQRKRPEAVRKGIPTEEEAAFKRGAGAMSADNLGFEAVVHAGEDPSSLMRSEINPSEMRASIKRKMAEAERIEDAALATQVEDENIAVSRPASGNERETAYRASSPH